MKVGIMNRRWQTGGKNLSGSLSLSLSIGSATLSQFNRIFSFEFTPEQRHINLGKSTEKLGHQQFIHSHTFFIIERES